MKLLSVVIPKSPVLHNLCKQELKGLDYEIISTVDLREGLGHASGEYVCLVEEGADFAEGYFWEQLRVFTSQPSFRKLAMVSGVVANREWDSQIYGYLLSGAGTFPTLLPSHLQSSSQPYAIQIGYIPGAIIRRSVLDPGSLTEDALADSVRLSLRLWSEGSRCYLNPRATYYDNSGRKLQYPSRYEGELPEQISQVTSMFKREMVG